MTTATRQPQQFRYRHLCSDKWQYGVCIPRSDKWSVQAGMSSATFNDDPWEVLGQVLGYVTDFEWIDNDYGWEG